MPVAERIKSAQLQKALLESAEILLRQDERSQLKPSHKAVQVHSPSPPPQTRLHERAVSLTVHLIAASLACLQADDVRAYKHETIFTGTKFSGTRIDPDTDVSGLEKEVGELIRLCDAPSDGLERALILMELYESVLDYQVDSVPSLHVSMTANAKKRRGQFYTPLALTRKVVRAAMERLSSTGAFESLESLSDLKILDPAMGAGIFLLCSLEFLEQRWHQLSTSNKTASTPLDSKNQFTPRFALTQCLHGVDIDPLACEVAGLALWLYNEEISANAAATATNPSENPAAEFAATATDRRPTRTVRPTSDFQANLRCADALLSGLSSQSILATGNQSTIKINDKSTIETNLGAHQPASIFLWDVQFEKVFNPPEKDSQGIKQHNRGFDAIVSNPPWELVKPNSQEFFARRSPDFRKLGKQDALLHIQHLLENETDLARDWQAEQDQYQVKSRFIRDSVRTRTRSLFQAKGEADLNIYKLFLDLGFSLLKSDGCLSMLVPSGILVDKGASELRRQFLTLGNLYRIESYINNDRTFDIHPSFTYSLIAVQKKSEVQATQDTFEIAMNSGLSYQQKDITLLSPKWLTIFDISSAKDLEILKKLHATGTPLGSTDSDSNSTPWNPSFRREFDMTNDSKLFISVESAESAGFRADIFGNWLQGKWKSFDKNDSQLAPEVVLSADGESCIKLQDIASVLQPLYEGRMIGQFDYSQKCHVNGSGRTALWSPNPSTTFNSNTVDTQKLNFAEQLLTRSKIIRPHFLIDPISKNRQSQSDKFKVGYLAVGSATNVRTMLASALYDVPCGNSIPTFTINAGDIHSTLSLTACLNSFAFDYLLRMRMTGNNLNYFLLQECPLPDRKQVESNSLLSTLTASLNLMHARNAAQWLQLPARINDRNINNAHDTAAPRALIEALVAATYGLNQTELAWILRDCDRPSPKLSKDKDLNLKGFWRVDKEKPVQSRLTNMTLEAFAQLQQIGIEAFTAKHLKATDPLLPEEKIHLQSMANTLRDITAIRAQT